MASPNGNKNGKRGTESPSDSDITLVSNASRIYTPDPPARQEDDAPRGTSGSERGPLLEGSFSDHAIDASIGHSDDHDDAQVLLADDGLYVREESRSTTYLVLLTTCMLGLQMGWSVEMAGISPFLLSLGMSKSLLALVWIAGPLSGTVVQPYVGVKSDNCRLKWGRRRPFIVWGSAATIVSLLSLAWTREIVATLASIFHVDLWGTMASPAYQVLAIFLIYVLDFAINVVQAGVRAFIIDCLPTHQQETGNAWASRVAGLGHIIAYLIGFVYLPGVFPWLGNTQFKVFVAIVCAVMFVTMAISCIFISEPSPESFGPPSPHKSGVFAFFKALYHSVSTLPRQVQVVCLVQICAWIGWFPYLFYSTTYIGGLYADPFFRANPNLSDQEIDEILEKGTRIGTFALLLFAITTFTSSVLLPMIIPPTYKPVSDISGHDGSSLSSPRKANSSRGQAAWKKAFARLYHTLARPDFLQIPHLTLRRAWIISHLVFTTLMWMTFFVSTPTGGIILIGLVGIPWAIANWAPFALIAAEISIRNAARRSGHSYHSANSDLESETIPGPASGRRASWTTEGDSSTDQAGVLLGIHNVAISAPQVIATLVSSAMFQALQKPRGTPGDDSVGWVMRMGGICALAAAWCTRYVREGKAS